MSPLNLENRKILIVEDDDMSFLYLNHLLLLTGGMIVREKTGPEALELYRKNLGFDLILMDLQLPGMDGKQVTREIRNHDLYIPIIAQTADKSPLEKELALEAGCTEVITKPYSMEELFEVIGKYISE
ncbi:MAG: response regulator [Bacteroidales bacterium]|nr:response regulator [Bacteroidales bacterium]